MKVPKFEIYLYGFLTIKFSNVTGNKMYIVVLQLFASHYRMVEYAAGFECAISLSLITRNSCYIQSFLPT